MPYFGNKAYLHTQEKINTTRDSILFLTHLLLISNSGDLTHSLKGTKLQSQDAVFWCTPKKLETATQLQLLRYITDFKQATGFQINRHTLRKLCLISCSNHLKLSVFVQIIT
jgi:hypothetical protein